MYIFRLAPISADRVNTWQEWDAISYSAMLDPDDTLAPPWSPMTTYMTGDYAGRNQYAFISLANNNTDDPIHNYIGRTPDPWRDSTFGYGKNTWLRARMLSKYLCFNRVQPGYTWSTEGSFSFTITPELTMTAEDALFFGDGNVSTPLYLILNDVIASSIVINYKNISGTSIRSETVNLVQDNSFVSDAAFNMELPGTPDNTIIRKYDLTEGIKKITVTINPPISTVADSRAGIGGFYIGRATRIGITQQDKLTFGYTDFSKLTEDAWGHIAISRRKFSRNIDAEVFVSTAKADNVFRLIQHVRVTPTFFFFSNRLEEAILPGTVISGLTCITGMAKTSSIDKQNTKSSPLKVFIESLPVSFNDLMIKENVNICGMPYLPVVPVVDTTPVVPPTPPPSTVAVTGVSLNKETLPAYLNKTYTLIATVTPSNAGNKSVTWTSSAPLVVSVNSLGILTCKAPGSATITVTTVDGGFTDTCLVSVSTIRPPWEENVFIFYEPLNTDDNIFKFDVLRNV